MCSPDKPCTRRCGFCGIDYACDDQFSQCWKCGGPTHVMDGIPAGPIFGPTAESEARKHAEQERWLDDLENDLEQWATHDFTT